jgi:predicted RNase H-like nuclease (RuvC/YqgF family)
METNSSPQSLKSPDQQRLQRLEELEEELEVVIHGSSWRIGEALLEIRNDRLYRDEYSSFDAYCKERWGHNRAWADRLIKSVELIANFEKKVEEDLDPIGSTFPLNESQTRALRGLTPDQQIQVMREVIASGERITAKLIAEFAQKYKQPEQELVDETEDESEEGWEEDWDEPEDFTQLDELSESESDEFTELDSEPVRSIHPDRDLELQQLRQEVENRGLQIQQLKAALWQKDGEVNALHQRLNQLTSKIQGFSRVFIREEARLKAIDKDMQERILSQGLPLTAQSPSSEILSNLVSYWFLR